MRLSAPPGRSLSLSTPGRSPAGVYIGAGTPVIITRLLSQIKKYGISILIDHMRHWSIVGPVRPLHGPGRQRLHASAGQPGRTEGEDQLGPTTSHLGPCRRRTFRRTRRTNKMCSTNSLRLRRRHHRLPGIHRRSHSDSQAATLRGSGPVSGPSGPVAGRA